MKRALAAALLLFLLQATAQAMGAKVDRSTTSVEAVVMSTTPIGSPFYRHLAYDFDIDLKELVKFERKGFGRTEIVMLVLIASSTEKPLKDYGNRRLKDKVTLRELVKEADLDYNSLYKTSREIKSDIETRDDKTLPPPVFEKISPNKEKIEKPILETPE